VKIVKHQHQRLFPCALHQCASRGFEQLLIGLTLNDWLTLSGSGECRWRFNREKISGRRIKTIRLRRENLLPNREGNVTEPLTRAALEDFGPSLPREGGKLANQQSFSYSGLTRKQKNATEPSPSALKRSIECRELGASAYEFRLQTLQRNPVADSSVSHISLQCVQKRLLSRMLKLNQV